MSESHSEERASRSRASGAADPDVVDPFSIAVLDPSTAPRVPAGPDEVPRVLPTVYVVDRLLVETPASDAGGVAETVQKALGEAGVDVAVRQIQTPRDGIPGFERLNGAAKEALEEVWVTGVWLAPSNKATAIDAYSAVTALRSSAAASTSGIALDHVLVASTPLVGIGKYWPGIGKYWPGIGGPSDAGAASLFNGDGRIPVYVPMGNPARHWPVPVRPPVVALPDTGIGHHPWFDADPSVTIGTDVGGIPIGGTNADLTRVVDPMTGDLADLAGHGTFIAGLIRQSCPEARILSVPVMSSAGLADEMVVRQNLALLLARHIDAQERDDPSGVIDVLSISMGYYPEQDDTASTQGFRRLFELFGERGVLVVAGAGNDATSRGFAPAVFAAGGADGVPLTSVGAQNPNGRTAALFSNDGPWVRVLRPGVSVVSTVPTTFDAGGQPSAEAEGVAVAGASGLVTRARGTQDPDDYRSGFGIWSGTSFSAPLFAGSLAARLAEADDLADVGQSTMSTRAGRVLGEVLTGPEEDPT
ncbi:putative protease [Nostocoides japonicum T1-X7]|uniref:Putative protease n=1 Tax=Nostocoides japonicum T1-X7 TaxID=1194083 RepID=A0A077LVJ8_9MICO|nr:S8/S53 family peptidase [Tetrasphaera japonica]CCH77953.1 putative protease [Tetrasphaera japonica T1-X7]